MVQPVMFVKIGRLRRHQLGLEDEIAQAVKDRPVFVNFDAAQQMRTVPNHGMRPGVDTRFGENRQKVCGHLFGIAFHLMRVNADHDVVGAPLRLPDPLHDPGQIARMRLSRRPLLFSRHKAGVSEQKNVFARIVHEAFLDQ